jgi:hypothetical protein
MGQIIREFTTSATFNLFNRPSIWEGYARLADYYGSLNAYNRSKTGELADINALKSDWASLNTDMKKAYLKVLRAYVEKEKTQI